jgi:hypothetical protein
MRFRLLSLIGVTLASHAQGQVPFEACRDRTDHPIAVVVDNSIAYAGVATFRNEHPVILWNARTNQCLSRTEQLFIYLHECAKGSPSTGLRPSPGKPHRSRWATIRRWPGRRPRS